MTYQDTAVHRAADKKEGVWLDGTQPPPMSREGLATQAAAQEPPPPHTAPDDLIATPLDGGRLEYVKILEYLGFRHKASIAILRYWAAVELDAPTGGPYSLLGVALAAIAELGEPETRGCRGRGGGRGGGDGAGLETKSQSRSEWYLAFAWVLNSEALAAIHSGGAYMAPNFTEAKWLVHRMVTGRWDSLVGGRDAI
ncbi:hypothetical protein GGR51DRAFT_241210 [Nemania sp. FL0031]|nr:hypothetical protein GGR51DRAFT_241210 [Nemania sp. FL0031]